MNEDKSSETNDEHPVEKDRSGEQGPKSSKPKVLELRSVRFGSESEHTPKLVDENFVVKAGELVFARVPRALKLRGMVSMFMGLTSPIRGEVAINGVGWEKLSWDQQFEKRSQVGRVFEEDGWIANLNVKENVLLSSLHHGMPFVTVQEQAESLARRFGISNVSSGRPAFVEPVILQIHQWIRALIGPKSLLLLERPMRSVPLRMLETFVSVLDDVIQKGTSVIWFDSDVESPSRIAKRSWRVWDITPTSIEPSTGSRGRE